MTLRCLRCHRPLRHPTDSGMGRVCAKRVDQPQHDDCRDLFGYDTEKAAAQAVERVTAHVEVMAQAASRAVRAGFEGARAAA